MRPVRKHFLAHLSNILAHELRGCHEKGKRKRKKGSLQCRFIHLISSDRVLKTVLPFPKHANLQVTGE
jgi:hypothetical protein